MTPASQAGDAPLRKQGDETTSSPVEVGRDLLTALTGRDANRDRAVANRTRRVLQSSLGVMREQKQDRSRIRSIALAVTVVVLLIMAPLVWEAVDSLIAGEHLGDLGSQLSLWACIIMCPALLGAALVAGWWKHRP